MFQQPFINLKQACLNLTPLFIHLNPSLSINVLIIKLPLLLRQGIRPKVTLIDSNDQGILKQELCHQATDP